MNSVKQQEDGLFEGLSPPGDGQRGIFWPVECPLKTHQEDKHTERKKSGKFSFHYFRSSSSSRAAAAASHLHGFTMICALELLGSSVWSGEDIALRKHASTLGWMSGW